MTLPDRSAQTISIGVALVVTPALVIAATLLRGVS